MSATFRSRQIQVNQVVFDQVDLFQNDFFSRVPGLLVTDMVLTVFFNNTSVSWPLVDGTSVTDSQVVSGFVYWTELPNHAYGLRFLPNSLGHWNVSLTYTAGQQIVTVDYDVVNLPLTVDSGLTANFCS